MYKSVIIIVNYNTKQLLKNCLQSILNRNWQYQYEIWVVDNGSEDGSLEIIKKDFPKVHLINAGTNLGFAAGNNLGLKKVKADLYILLNSDTEVGQGSLDSLVDFMQRSQYGLGSCSLHFKDGNFQPNAGDNMGLSAIFFWLSGLDDLLPFKEVLPSLHRKYRSYYQGEREVGWVSGSVMAIKKEVIKKIGLLDEKIFMYGEDIEFCLRAKRAGFKIGWTEDANIMHIGGGSTKDSKFKQWQGEYKGLLYICRKYFGDPATTILKLSIYLFTLIRVVAFLVIGKFNISITYAKIIANI